MIYGYARVSTAAQDETGQVRQLKAAGCEKVFREKITGTTADRPQLAKLMKALDPGDVVITPAVDRLSRDTTDLLVIARDMQRAGAGIRSLADPFLDTTSHFAEIILPSSASRPSSNPAVSSNARRAAGPMPRPTASNSAASRSSPASAARGPRAPLRGRDAPQRRAQLQCQSRARFHGCRRDMPDSTWGNIGRDVCRQISAVNSSSTLAGTLENPALNAPNSSNGADRSLSLASRADRSISLNLPSSFRRWA
jgi:Resolvase, N terminal domain